MTATPTSNPTPTPTPLPTPPPLEDQVAVPLWVTTELQYLGMTILIIGVMAVAMTPIGSYRRTWGTRVLFLGLIVMIVGFGATWVNELLNFIIQG
jgi:hypothetical protein